MSKTETFDTLNKLYKKPLRINRKEQTRSAVTSLLFLLKKIIGINASSHSDHILSKIGKGKVFINFNFPYLIEVILYVEINGRSIFTSSHYSN